MKCRFKDHDLRESMRFPFDDEIIKYNDPREKQNLSRFTLNYHMKTSPLLFPPAYIVASMHMII